MKIFDSSPEELVEIKISDVLKESNDKGLVIVDRTGDRGEGLSDEVKEAVALDAILFGPSEAAKIHGVPESSASKYKDGKDIADVDTRANVLSVKNGIQDKAIAKLMDTLDMFNPKELTKPIDVVNAASKLSVVVEKMGSKDNRMGEGGVHIHFYSPRQKKINEYDIIDVE